MLATFPLSQSNHKLKLRLNTFFVIKNKTENFWRIKRIIRFSQNNIFTKMPLLYYATPLWFEWNILANIHSENLILILIFVLNWTWTRRIGYLNQIDSIIGVWNLKLIRTWQVGSNNITILVLMCGKWEF